MELVASHFLTFDRQIPSINSYYKPGRNRIYLNPEVKAYKANIIKQLTILHPDRSDLLNKWKSGEFGRLIKFKIVYLLSARRFLRDEDNLRKATQDAIFSYFMIDDMNITDSASQRNQIKSDDSFNEYIMFNIYFHDENRLFDIRNLKQ